MLFGIHLFRAAGPPVFSTPGQEVPFCDRREFRVCWDRPGRVEQLFVAEVVKVFDERLTKRAPELYRRLPPKSNLA